jgi:hypothetical protein
MQTHDEPAPGWTLVLRRQPVRLVEGHPEGAYTDAYELICWETCRPNFTSEGDVTRVTRKEADSRASGLGIAVS